MTSAQTYQTGTIGDMIVNLIERYPERIAFIDGDTRITYQDLGHRISQAISLFKSLGFGRGSGVVQLSGNRAEVFMVMAAAYLMGMRSVTLQALGGVDDHAYIVNDCDASLFIVDGPYLHRAHELQAKCPKIQHWFAHDDHAAGMRSFWDQAKACAPAPLVVEAQPEDVIRLAYTGGTTGKPKGVMLSNRSVVMQALLMLAGRDWPREIRLLCPTPISHGAGALLVPTLSRGGTVILQHGFDKDRFLDGVERHRANVTFLVPTMIYGLLDHPRTRQTDLSSLQTLLYGAAPMSPARIREAIDVFGPILMQSYGQSEAPSNILILTQDDHLRNDSDILSSAGKPYPGVTVRLLDDEDREVDRGGIGEICVRGPLVMDGYWKQPDLTVDTLRNGWLHTGDMAYQDDAGYFHLVDRKKDMIISGGFNVYPKEIENVLTTHPAVAAAAVIGVPDEKWGEAVKAVVVVRAGCETSADALIALVKERKGAVNTPKSVDFVDVLPLTPLGKPDKKALRDRYWKGLSRSVN
jgi:fatty-acyl-CoA synthase